MTTGEIKEQRSSYLADILQPRRDGVLSKEYLETFGSLGIQATPEEIKNAKYVWQDLPNINSLNKTQKVKRKRDVGAGVKKKK